MVSQTSETAEPGNVTEGGAATPVAQVLKTRQEVVQGLQGTWTELGDLGDIFEVTLDNGLKVILKEARHAPIACVSTWYRAGSKHESAGTTGLAHLLEHMMFKGTEKHGKGEFDRILKENGAGNNASTWMDRTNYYEMVASDRLEIALELEADRMRGALFTQADLEDEMPVVRNEMERGEDDPHRKVYRQVQSTAFQAHPYHWPTIGWRSDVEAITAEDIRAFYDTYYRPNNAFLVIVGDFEVSTLVALVKKHFGPLERGEQPPAVRTEEPPQLGERRFVIRETGGSPYIMQAYRAPEGRHKDVYALDVLSQVFGQGRTSRLYRSLVKGGLATSACAFNMAKDTQDPYLFFIEAEPAPGNDLAAVEHALDAQVHKLKEELITDAELTRAIKQNRVDYIYTRDRVSSQAFALGESEVTGGYQTLGTYLAGLESVTAEDVRRVAVQYLVEDQRTVGCYIPRKTTGGGGGGVQAASGAQARHLSPVAAMIQKHKPGLCFRDVEVAGKTFPQGGSSDKPAIRRGVLSNGTVVIVQPNHFNQTVELRGVLHAGGVYEGVPGLASVTAHMMDRGTAKRSAHDIAELLESNGAAVGFGAGRETMRFSTRSISEDFPMVVGLLGEMLCEPTFPDEELKVVKQGQINEIKRALDSTYVRAALKAYEAVYGSKSPYCHLLEGTEESVESISVDEIMAFHRTFITSSRPVISVVGDVEPDAVFELLEKALAGLRGTQKAMNIQRIAEANAGVKLKGVKRIEVEVADKSQVDLVMVRKGMSRTDKGYYAAFVANFILGGDFTSRLNKELRDNQGLTYGTHSRFSAGFGEGPWVANIGVNPENLGKAIDGMQSLVGTFVAEGITEQELTSAKRYITGSYPVRLETNGAIAAQLLEANLFDLGDDYIRDYPKLIESLTLDEVNGVIATHFDAENYALVSAGSHQKA